MGVHMSAKTMASKVLHTAAMVLVVAASGDTQAAPLNISDIPLFLNPAVPPLNMIIMGRDHKLYYEAYNDASDLNNDGVLDTKYKGYELKFPAPAPRLSPKASTRSTTSAISIAMKCYTYTAGVWDPTSMVGARKTCAGGAEWSGDFLNYLTTSRIDALRKVMYGGDRSTDLPPTPFSSAPMFLRTRTAGARITAASRMATISPTTPRWSPPTTGIPALLRQYDVARRRSGRRHTLCECAAVTRIAQNVQGGRRIWNWVSKERPVADSTGTFMDTVQIVRASSRRASPCQRSRTKLCE